MFSFQIDTKNLENAQDYDKKLDFIKIIKIMKNV